jgi:hypothetical protein
MTEIRVRNLDDAVAEALEAAAKHAGRSLESHVREILKEASRSGIGDFPQASDWVRSGFDEVHELIPGRQYLAWAAMTPYRITITRSVTGEDPEWNTLIEEAVQVPDRDGTALSVWARATDVAQRLLGTSPGMALRDAIHWVAEYAGVDTVSHAREAATRNERLSPNFRQIVDRLDTVIKGSKAFPRESMVIWTTRNYEIYVNQVNDDRGALMVYRRGEDWSITDGKATYFPLGKLGHNIVVEALVGLGIKSQDIKLS